MATTDGETMSETIVDTNDTNGTETTPSPEPAPVQQRMSRLKIFVIVLLVFAVIGLIIAMALLAAKYDQCVKKTKPTGIAFKGFTADANLTDVYPWCQETRYAIAYVNNTIQGPWSDYTNGNPLIQSAHLTFPRMAIANDPLRQDGWTVVVKRATYVNGEPLPDSVIENLPVAWQNPQHTEFIDFSNPCNEAYLPPRPDPPYPFGDPNPGSALTWDRTPEANQPPWCVATRYRAFFLGAFDVSGPWSRWSVESWESQLYIDPVFTVLRPGTPTYADTLQLYWAPSAILVPANAFLRIEYRVSPTDYRTFETPWPSSFGTRTSPDFLATWITNTLARPYTNGSADSGLGVDLTFGFTWEAVSSDDVMALATFDGGSNQTIQALRIPYVPGNVLNILGFSSSTTNTEISRGSNGAALGPLSFYWNKANVISSGNAFTTAPGLKTVDRNNMCLGIYPSQPPAPTFTGFAVDLANPSQPPLR